MAKQCKYAKKDNANGACCYCTSAGNPNTSKARKSGYPTTGWADGRGWWNLCINGKSFKGVTPSNCDYYR